MRGISNGSGQFHDAGVLSLLPGVSVVITAYNYATVLPAAIKSVLAQDYLLVETIVVDDGSTDNTREVVARFGDRVRYVYQENAGASAARNSGIRTARHPFVAFLDADDEWLPTMVSTIMRAFVSLPPDFGLVACSCKKLNNAGVIQKKAVLTTRSACEVHAKDLILMNRFATDAVIARREVLEKGGFFDTSLTTSEDRDMWIRVADLCRIYFLPDPLLIVRVHAESLSTTNADRMKMNLRQVLRRSQSRRTAPHWNPLFWAKAYAFQHYQVAWMYMDAGRPGSACREVLKSLVLWPFFMRPDELHENRLFRVRSLLDFCSRMLWKKE